MSLCFAVDDNKVEFLQDVFKALNMGSFKTMLKQYERLAKPMGIFLGREEDLQKIKDFFENKSNDATGTYFVYTIFKSSTCIWLRIVQSTADFMKYFAQTKFQLHYYVH